MDGDTRTVIAGLTEACPDDVLLARDLIVRFGWNAMSYQILNPGIRLWFTQDHNAVVGYVDGHGYRVVAGEPVCERSSLPAIVSVFQSETFAAHRRICYFGAEEYIIKIMSDLGPVSKLLLGSQPVWNPTNWPSRINSKASLRAQLHRARNKGVVVREWDSVRATGSHDLERCLREWLDNRGLPAMHFLVEPETLARVYDRRIFVAERAGKNVGFIVASPVPFRRGWLIEQIIRGRSAPNGTAELMLDAAMNALAGSGAEYVTLGLSPLSVRSGIPQVAIPRWMSLMLSGVRVLGSRFYNFDGLDSFKSKFLPDKWEPIYAVTSDSRISFRSLHAIAGAFSGMSPGLFLLRAGIREVRRLPLAKFQRRSH